ncbi:MAG: asparagine synthase (glutamine-hydrolyzing) [Actinobacteria bacterium]|nr:asparagine synthase (glutamine-hydrolyzing) [Actinomycetota bacterium]
MCRIFGHLSAGTAPYELRMAAAAQRHGGPDAQTCATGPGWGIGSNRLAIMDLDGGQQPYRLGEVHAVFNGEIYNHDALRRDLRARGHRFADRCDGSIIPALYLEHGTGFAELLDGMFAIALVDLRHEPTLVLATDDSGMKSLYYQWIPATQEFYFASEIPGLLCFRAVQTDLWLPGLEEYLATRTPFGEQTMLAGIRTLPPAATVVFDRSHGLRITRRERVTDLSCPATAAGCAELVGRRVSAAVEALTRADVPIAAITSGGLDSGYVTALASRAIPELPTFNIAYTGTWPGDERHYASEIARQLGTRHHQVEIDPATFPDLIPDVVWHLGQPNADPITLSTFALFRAVRDAGYTVALTGDAADELFGGYDRLRVAVSAPGDWATPYLDALSAVAPAVRHRLYSSDYRDYLAGVHTYRSRLAELLARDDRSRLQRLSEVELRHRMPAYHLRRVDHLSMAHGVEARLPYCQRGVVDVAAVLPDPRKIDGGQVKRVLYDACRGTLPASVLERPKQPFTLPVSAMLRPGSTLLTYAEDVLHPDRLRRRGLLDPSAVRQLIEGQRQRPDDRLALAIWSLMIFEVWADHFLSATGPNRSAAPSMAGVMS